MKKIGRRTAGKIPERRERKGGKEEKKKQKKREVAADCLDQWKKQDEGSETVVSFCQRLAQNLSRYTLEML